MQVSTVLRTPYRKRLIWNRKCRGLSDACIRFGAGESQAAGLRSDLILLILLLWVFKPQRASWRPPDYIALADVAERETVNFDERLRNIPLLGAIPCGEKGLI